jgi:hypothetical protein
MTRELDQDIERVVGAVQVLAGDVQAAAKLSKTKDTQFARRAYVRAAFALVEGNLNLMAEVILNAMSRGEIALKQEELEVLRQKRVSGDNVEKPKFVSLPDRTTRVLEIFPRLFDKRFRPDKGSQGWRDFKDAIGIRNRITHPKDASSLHIPNAELDNVERAREWFAATVEALLTECDWQPESPPAG